MTGERIYFYNNNDNTVESVTFAGEDFTKVVTHGENNIVFTIHALTWFRFKILKKV